MEVRTMSIEQDRKERRIERESQLRTAESAITVGRA